MQLKRYLKLSEDHKIINDGKYVREHLVLYASLSSEGDLVTSLGQQREFVRGWGTGTSYSTEAVTTFLEKQ